MLKVGLTGGIGSGKTTVAGMLAELGAVVIDSDRLAREAVAPGTPGLARVVDEFGPELLAPDGSLDRARLGAIVFGDQERLSVLEAILHPDIAARADELAAAAPPDAVVVFDVPLLAEKGLASRYDVVVVVDASLQAQLRRLVTIRGLTESDAQARVAAQAHRNERLAVADYVVENDGDLDTLRVDVERLWAQLRCRCVDVP